MHIFDILTNKIPWNKPKVQAILLNNKDKEFPIYLAWLVRKDKAIL